MKSFENEEQWRALNEWRSTSLMTDYQSDGSSHPETWTAFTAPTERTLIVDYTVTRHFLIL